MPWSRYAYWRMMSWYNTFTRWSAQHRLLLFTGLALLALEWLIHMNSFRVSNPARPYLRDRPFYAECVEPDISGKRESAVIIMLARNNEADSAARSVRSLEKHFNQWYHYPIVFLNDAPWDQNFIDTLTAAASGESSFEVIPKEMWGYPEWINQDKARQSMAAQQSRGLLYAGLESYHHMCRFNSGFFYDHPALKKYKWYWRVDSDVEFTCAMPYDPFREMARSGKKYGYAMALWERGDTAPTLFRKVSDYRTQQRIHTSPLYTAMTEPSWGPFLLRKVMRVLQGRNADGDGWNYCHFWSNFEIGDMEFFRGKKYRDFFNALDQSGGFYFERWGDAPVHSFGVGLFLKPEQIHYFEDFGYIHDNIQHCPTNAKRGQLPNSPLLGDGGFDSGTEDGIGCRCQCQPNRKPLNFECQNILGKAFR